MNVWEYAAIAAASFAVALAACVLVTSFRIRRSGRPGPPRRADAIVVFAAGLWPSGPSLSMRVRVARTLEVYRDGWAPEILCSGGPSGASSEAGVMRALLIAEGVPADAIIPDDGGVSTRRAIQSARSFSKQRGWSRVLAVSSPYHMYRIEAEARRQGLDIVPCPSAPRPWPRTRYLFILALRQHLREILKVLGYAFRSWMETTILRGWGRPFGSVRRRLVRRVQWFLMEADEVAEASEQIGENIKKRIAGSSDAVSVTTPAAAALAWPVPGEVISRFGIRYRRLHSGVDIRSGYGAAIRAAAGGRVLLAEWFGPYGNLSVIDHGGGLATLYAHQAGLVVREGETVQAGQLVGFLGDTGRSSGPHLHFEVRVHGTPVDPLAYLGDAPPHRIS
ncbi:MAG: peptidoglycan DD-metalloendopeptidase family protein [Bryobacteraceae bacterium]